MPKMYIKSSIWSGFEIKNWIEDQFQSSPWRSWSIVPQNNRDLNQGLLHLWSKFGDPSWNGWWVIARTSSWLKHGRTHRQTDTGNDNTRRPKLASGKNCVLSLMINLKTYTAYHMKTLCNTSMWPAILEDNHVWNIHANFGKDEMSTIMTCLHTTFHRNFIQYDVRMLDINHIANNLLCNMSTKNRTEIRPFPFKIRWYKTSSAKSQLYYHGQCFKTVLI